MKHVLLRSKCGRPESKNDDYIVVYRGDSFRNCMNRAFVSGNEYVMRKEGSDYEVYNQHPEEWDMPLYIIRPADE